MIAVVTTRVAFEAAKMVKAHERDGEDMKCEEIADVADMGNYFIASQIPNG